MDCWRKRATDHEARREAAGLRWLGEASDGVRVVEVLGADERGLRLERIESARSRPSNARAFGAALAATHAAGADGWGAPPPGTSGDGWLGGARLPTPVIPPPTWGAFYAEHRVLPYLEAAADAGAIDRAGVRVVERVAGRLDGGELEHDQPVLVAQHPNRVARLHGDLWSGNVLWTPPEGEAVLIDAAAHGGHAETDLAMLALFGLPHLMQVLTGYTEASRLAAGWQDRVALHQLHPLLVHTVLFGGSYGSQAVAAARRYA